VAGEDAQAQERLLRALAEQLKLPLLQIARQAELAHAAEDIASLATISYVADTALRLVDGFLLSSEIGGQQRFELESVSVSSVLQDTAHKLAPLAKQNNCELELSLGGKYGPVMAHRQSLESALMLLGYSLIETRTVEDRRHRVVMAAHRSASGLVAGVFDNQPGLSTDMFRRGQALYGNARSSMPAMSGSSGAGVFVADNLLRAMEAPLHVARHHKLTGLATTLHQSSQLSLV
jgi:hypothetical protein